MTVNLTLLHADVENIRVRIVGGTEVKEPFPWFVNADSHELQLTCVAVAEGCMLAKKILYQLQQCNCLPFATRIKRSSCESAFMEQSSQTN